VNLLFIIIYFLFTIIYYLLLLLGLNNIEEDRLYDKLKNMQRTWADLSIKNYRIFRFNVGRVFKKYDFIELPKIVGKIFSISISNAFA
jgi:hypothetical protein